MINSHYQIHLPLSNLDTSQAHPDS